MRVMISKGAVLSRSTQKYVVYFKWDLVLAAFRTAARVILVKGLSGEQAGFTITLQMT